MTLTRPPSAARWGELLSNAVLLLKGERGLVMTPIPGISDMQVQAAYGLDADTVWTSGQISQSILRQVATDMRPLLSHCAMQDPRFAETTSVVLSELRSVMCVPVMVNDSLWGVFYIDNPIVSGNFKPSDLNLLRKYAAQLTTLVQRSLV